MTKKMNNLLELQEPYGSYVLQVLTIYKQSNYYDMSKMIPAIYQAICNVSESIIQEAIAKYKVSKDKLKPDRIPHPSYFIAIIKRLVDETGRVEKSDSPKNNEINLQWGKGI